MCQLFETIRIERGQACYVAYHQQRVDRSIGGGNILLEDFIETLSLPWDGCHKLRITYSINGIEHHTITPYMARSITTLRLVIADEIEYKCKWEERGAIEQLSKMRGTSDDILIVRHGLVTDTSIANTAFYDGQQWLTPAKPMLAGTCRARLVEQGILTPADITAKEIEKYQKIAILNAMIDFDPKRESITIQK